MTYCLVHFPFKIIFFCHMTIFVYLSQIGYNHYPRQRKLGPELKATVKEMMKLKANKKLIQASLVKDGNRVILLKDLHNLQAEDRPKNCGNTLVQQLDNIPGV